MDSAWLPLAAFAAGFVDAIAGGGGLLQLPALLIGMPHAPVVAVLGTNKASSVAGTAFATARYAPHVSIPWKVIGPAALAAFVGSVIGARFSDVIRPEALRPLVVVLLGVVLVHTVRSPRLGLSVPENAPPPSLARALSIGAALGLYDGFFGPGTGSFLLFLFVATLGLDFLVASASAKVVNLATNIAAVLVFAHYDAIVVRIALPMAACNILGALVGTRVALRKGAPVVRSVFLVVASVLWVKLAYDVAISH